MRKILLILFAIIYSSANAQKDSSFLKNNQFKGGLKVLGAAFSYERKLASKITLYSEASIQMIHTEAVYFKTEYTANYSYNYTAEIEKANGWAPVLYSGIRHYYNLNRRVKKQKPIVNNSFSFFSLGATLVFKPTIEKEELNPGNFGFITTTWGIQRPIGKHFTYEFEIGGGYVKMPQYFDGAGFAPFADFKLEYVFK